MDPPAWKVMLGSWQKPYICSLACGKIAIIVGKEK